MPYTGLETDPRRDARDAAGTQRAFARRIDCDDDGRARPPVNPSAGSRPPREAAGRGTRPRLDID